MQIKIDLKIFIFLLFFFLLGQIEIYVWLIGFAFLHEIGHLIMGLCIGLKPREIKITPLGVAITFKNEIQYHSPNQKMLKEIAVASAGPLVNVAVVILCMAAKWECIQIIVVNVVLFLFNLLPIYPLDGGRIIKSVLGKRYSYWDTEKYIYTVSNTMMIILTMICSIVILYYHNIALLLALAYLWWMVLRENKRYGIWKRCVKYTDEWVGK